MTSKECVKLLDWSSAIAAATLEIEKDKNDANAYLYRGIARCFISDKEGKHKEAIDDLSKAIVLYKEICEKKIKNDKKEIENNIYEAYYYRAYAYYLDGDYERAIADCDYISKNNPCSYGYELFGKIYSAMGKYEEAVDKFVEAIKCCFNQNPQIPNPGLLQSYQEACKKMNNV